MRLAAYLCTSPHSIFYFRYPLPQAMHPSRKRRQPVEVTAEMIIGLFKAEVIHRRGPRLNNRCLLEPIGNIPPA